MIPDEPRPCSFKRSRRDGPTAVQHDGGLLDRWVRFSWSQGRAFEALRARGYSFYLAAAIVLGEAPEFECDAGT